MATTKIDINPSRQRNSPDGSGIDYFSLLPVELKNEIISLLRVQDRVKLRLMSRDFAVLTADGLFQDGLFTVRPHLNDMVRLEAVSKHPIISKGVKAVTIYVGDMRLDTFANYVMQRVAKKDHKKTSEIIERMYRPSLIHRHCQDLDRLLSCLPNLTAVTATSLASPFAGSGLELRRAWQLAIENSVFSFQHPNLSISRYSNILLAIRDTPAPVRKLVLDPLPIDCFTSDGISHTIYQQRQESLQNAVANIQELQVKVQQDKIIKFSSPEVNSIRRFFGSMCNLRSLSLTGRDKAPSFNLSMTFCGNVWPYLETLRLSGICAYERELLPFLLKHSTTLRRLHLSNRAIYLDKSSHKGILTTLKDQLELQNLEYLVEDNLGRPSDENLHRPIYDTDWKLTQSPDSSIPNAQLLEMYVQGKSLWPMAYNSPFKFTGWTRLPFEQLIIGLIDASSINIETLLEDE